MDLLERLFVGDLRAQDMSPSSDFWFGPVGDMTAAGVRLDADGAKKVSAWFRGREILANTLAMLPFGMYQWLPNDGGRDDAPQYYLHDVISHKPNTWQDSFGWRRMLMYWLIDHGNSYNQIVGNSRGFVSQLSPIHPSCVTPELTTGGKKRFKVKDPKTNQTYYLSQDEMFHLHICSDDGIVGKGILAHARACLGLNVTIEQFASRIFSKGSLSAGALEVPGVLSPEASKRMAESFSRSSSEWHLPKVLEQGAKWVPGQGMTPEDAQMLLSRAFGIDEIARFLGLPPHMLGSLERSTNNNIEHQGQEFIDYSLGPWLKLWEDGTNDQLVAQPAKFYAEFNRDALVRGDLAARWTAYVNAVTTGTFTRNEVRVMENKKKLPGLDEPLDPAHLTGKQPDGSPGQKKPGAKPARDQQQAIAVEAAHRLLRKELKAMQRFGVEHAADQDAFAAAVTGFYASHAELVAETLQMPQDAAARYCAGQAAQMVHSGLMALDAWTTDHYACGLVELALEAA